VLHYKHNKSGKQMDLIIMAFIFIVLFTGFWRWIDERE
jgi:hypothetical protein